MDNFFMLIFYLLLYYLMFVLAYGLVWLYEFFKIRKRERIARRKEILKARRDEEIRLAGYRLERERLLHEPVRCTIDEPIRKACGYFSDTAAQKIVQ